MEINRSLAFVERAEVFWSEGNASNAAKLIIIIHGKKPTPCHKINIVSMQLETPAFVVTWFQNSEYCLTKEVPFHLLSHLQLQFNQTK